MTGPPIRQDLLALTSDGLAALANRGLVKRATRELDDGPAPRIEVRDDRTVHATFADGIETTIPSGTGFDAATRSCGAATTCRHRVAVVLAYQRQQADAGGAAGASAAEAAPPTDGAATDAPAVIERWSPGELSDDDLEAHLGPRLLAVARRTHRVGYLARIRRPTATDPVASVELSSCTVRFLVPHEVAYARSDVAKDARGDAIALAVWAFRAADLVDLDRDELQLDVGGVRTTGPAAALHPALALAEGLLLDGVVNTGPSVAASFARVRHRLDAANLQWPLLALDDLAAQLQAHRDRSAHYAPETFAELLVELHARSRAAEADRIDSVPRAQVLGTEEAGSTPMRRAQLTSLGCRISGTAEDRTAEVFLAHTTTGLVLVLRTRWALEPDQFLTGAELAARRVVPGASLTQVAHANVVTESAHRSASRLLRIGSSRLAKTTVSPSSGAWNDLPDRLVVRDLGALAAALRGLAPRLIRPRVEAELVRVVAIAEVGGISYHPGLQVLEATIRDEHGHEATIRATHRAEAPTALDAIGSALVDPDRPPTFVSGFVHRSHGRILIDPIAIADGATVITPDLAPGTGDQPVTGTAAAPDPLRAALEQAVAVTAEAAHRGLAHVPITFGARIDRSAAQLRSVGFRSVADALDALVVALAAGPSPDVGVRWVDAHLRLLVTADCL